MYQSGKTIIQKISICSNKRKPVQHKNKAIRKQLQNEQQFVRCGRWWPVTRYNNRTSLIWSSVSYNNRNWNTHTRSTSYSSIAFIYILKVDISHQISIIIWIYYSSICFWMKIHYSKKYHCIYCPNVFSWNDHFS